MSYTSRIPAERICLLRLGAFGDTVHALALVNGLRRLYPDAHLTWILEPVPYEIARKQQEVDEFLIFHPDKGIAGLRELRHQLKQRSRFDLLLVPQVSLRSSFVTAVVDADVKLGFDWSRSREGHWGFVNRHLPSGSPRHAQDLFLEFLEYLGLGSYEPEWRIRFTDEEIARERAFFDAVGAPVLALVVASSALEKDWSPDRYAAVADHVYEQSGLVPMLVGGPSAREKEIAAAVAAEMSTSPIIALDRPVRDMLWKLHGSRVVVAPDTGPLHAAVALNRPTIGLYGYSNPRRCGPYSRFHDLLIDAYTDPGEEHTISRRTKEDRMNRITPEMVIEKIGIALERYE